MRPEGTLDHVEIRLRQSANQPLDMYVVGTKFDSAKNQPAAANPRDVATVQNHRLTMTPVWFPYRMENVSGSATYHNGAITLSNLRANHDNVVLRSNGNGSIQADGSWSVQLKDLSADSVRPDRELVRALPEGLATAVQQLSLTGLLSLQGDLTISGNEANTSLDWNVLLDVHDGHINCGIPLDHIFGQIRLWGGSSGEEFSSRGELIIDALHHKQHPAIPISPGKDGDIPFAEAGHQKREVLFRVRQQRQVDHMRASCGIRFRDVVVDLGNQWRRVEDILAGHRFGNLDQGPLPT